MRKILLLLLFLPNFLLSQDFSFLLQESEAKHLAVDKNFYWVGTDNSLYQYSKEDGQLCGIFNQSNSPVTQILVMDTDREGNLYVCTGSRLVRFEDFEWVDIRSCSSNTSGLVFNENNEVGTTSYWHHNSIGACNGNPLIGFSEIKRGLTFSYGKFNWYACGGSSSGCGCFQTSSQIRKMGNYFDDALLLSLSAYEEGHPDVLGNFWKSENNQLTTVFSPAGIVFSDVIDSDTTFNLVGFNLQNHKILENPDLGRFIYDGSNYNFLHSVPTFPINASFEDYEHKMFYLSEDKTPMAYINEEWTSLEKPAGIPFTDLSLINSKGDSFWFEHENEKNFALVTPTDYYYFTPTTDAIPNLAPSLKINTVANEIWRFYSETSELWRHDGLEWLNYQAADVGLEEWNLEEYRTSEAGDLWFPLEDNPLAFFAEFDFSSENWTLHSDSLAYIETFVNSVDFWSKNNQAFYHVVGQDTSYYPFPVSPNSNALRHINQSGYGWVSLTSIDGAPVYYFDGENYTEADSFGGRIFGIFSRNDTLYMLNRPEFENQQNQPVRYRKYIGSQLTYSHILTTPSPISHYPYFHSASARLFNFDENNNLIIQISVTWKTGLFNPPPVGYNTERITKTFSENTIVANPNFPQNFTIDNAFFDSNRKLWSFNENLGFACPYPLTPQNFFFAKNGDCSMPNYLLAGTLQGGSLPFSYQWNDGDSLAYRLEISAGDYIVTINNALGGEEIFQTTITSNSLIDIDAIITDISGIDETDGSIEIIASSDNEPLSIDWNTSDTTFTIDNLTTGSYEATITDMNDCEVIEIYNVSGDSINIQVEVLQTIDCQDNNTGIATLNFPQSEPDSYEILWSNGSTETTVNNLSGGTHFVTVYSYDGLTLIDTFYITNTSVDFSADYVTTVSSSESASDGTAEIFPNGGASPYTYNWSNGSSGSVIGNLSVGTYYVTITEASSCQIIDSLTIYSQISVSVNILEQPTCAGEGNGIIQITVTGGTGNYEVTIPTSNLGIAENIPVGTTTFSVIPEVGETVLIEITMEPLSPPMEINFEATPFNNGYEISPVISGGTPPFTYAWITGDTSSTFFTSNNFFISQVTITDALGCNETKSANLDLISNIDNNQTSNFQIFPNPTFNFINITLSEDIQTIQSLKIINVQGKEVLVNLVNEGVNINKDISHLPAGVYYVLLENEQQIMRGKFVKM